MTQLLKQKTKICFTCNSEYKKSVSIDYKQFEKSKFCSLICRGKYQSINNRGVNSSNYRGGKSACFDCKKELGYRYNKEVKRCKDCYIQFNIGANHPRWTGKYYKREDGKSFPLCINCNGVTSDLKSAYCKKCYVKEIHHSWKGGISKLNALIRTLPENRVWIKNCMKRDNFKCTECSNTGKLEVHHLHPFSIIIKENKINTIELARECNLLWDISNGKTLCHDCHKLTDNYGNKKI